MPDWQERITRDTEPAIRVEHDLRYGAAAPIVRASAAWCDLGCGNGIAARRAVEAGFDGHAILVDLDGEVAERAQVEMGLASSTALAADLTSRDDLARIAEALRQAGEAATPRAVTCFEVVEHLTTFVPLVEWLVELSAHERVTAVISVPNDAFWATANPHHETMWSEGAWTELQGMLPADRVLARQVVLQGSALVRDGEHGHVPGAAGLEVDRSGVQSHFIAAFGPAATELAHRAAVAQVDQGQQRAWVRQREAHLAYAEAQLGELRDWAKGRIEQLDDWRRYIHELEDQLGLPRSGSKERLAAERAGELAAPGGNP